MPVGTLKRSSEYRERVCTRLRLCRGSLAGSLGRAGVGRFLPAATGGVDGGPVAAAAPPLARLLMPCGGVKCGGGMGSPRSGRSEGVHVLCCVCASGVVGAEVASRGLDVKEE